MRLPIPIPIPLPLNLIIILISIYLTRPSSSSSAAALSSTEEASTESWGPNITLTFHPGNYTSPTTPSSSSSSSFLSKLHSLISTTDPDSASSNGKARPGFKVQYMKPGPRGAFLSAEKMQGALQSYCVDQTLGKKRSVRDLEPGENMRIDVAFYELPKMRLHLFFENTSRYAWNIRNTKT